MKTWTEMQTNTPCIALIEDIDNVFHGRENIVRRPGLFPMMPLEPKEGDGDKDKSGRGPMGAFLTFDCLLNCLDGVEKADGIFTIITTNDLSRPRSRAAAEAPRRHDRVHQHAAGANRQGGRVDLHGAGRQEAHGIAHPGGLRERAPRDGGVHRQVSRPPGNPSAVPGALRADRASMLLAGSLS
jgi:hypothetical protein